jgi:hypothetical protein
MLENMGRDDEMRAADADRQAVAERLRGALDEGRLDLHEYDERLQQAYAAKTYGDLKRLLSDLPPLRVPGEEAPNISTRGVTRRWLAETWESYFRTIAVVITIWAVTSIMSGDVTYFWPVWVAGPWGALLIYRTIAGLVAGEPRTWAAEQERKRAEKQAKQLAKRERMAREAKAIAWGDQPNPKSANDKMPS